MNAEEIAVKNTAAPHTMTPSIPVRDTSGGFAFVNVKGIPVPQPPVVEKEEIIQQEPVEPVEVVEEQPVQEEVAVVETVTQESQKPVSIKVSVEEPEPEPRPVQKIKGPVEFAHLEEPVEEQKPLQAVPAQYPKIAADPAEVKKPEAKFYINSQDEHEVEKIDIPEGVQSYQSRFDIAGSALAKELGSHLKPALKERFTRVIVSRWKDIRNTRETLEVLMRDKRLGGLGLPSSEAETISVAIDEKKKQVLNHTYPQSPTMPQAGAVPEEIFDTAQPTEQPAEQAPVAKAAPKEKKHAVSVSFMTEIKPRKGSRPKTPTPSVKNTELPPPAITTVGPLEELEQINMEYLRRLNEDPEKSAQKVHQKIDLLGDESFELKAQGVRAWKRSPAYQMYLDIGQKSIEAKLSVEEVIDQKLVGDMTLEEFETIADLNKSLQF